MTSPPVSIIIVSRHRPDALMRCLTALGQLLYAPYEIVVVADPAAIARLAPWQGRIKMQVFDQPNISAARNLGITLASGKIIAFIDDDAVAEPAWLHHLCAPFTDPQIMATGGYVRGRNGISFQWRGRMVDALAVTRDLPADDAPVIVTQQAGQALKTEGTNMAFRRSALAMLGGFDPALPFYLDETDVNLRLAATGAKAALVPLAQVHHGFAPSIRRHANRVPRDLSDVGGSLAVFLRKHAPQADHSARFTTELQERKTGLSAHLRAGRIDKATADALIASLHLGWAAGQKRHIAPLPPLPDATVPFLPFNSGHGKSGHEILTGSTWLAPIHRRRAERAVAKGAIVTLFLFSPTAYFHKMRYDPAGFWLQTGGIFGKSLRSDPLFRIWRRKDRVYRELNLVRALRTVNDHVY